ncbi:hypothetical protein PG996_009191 [Apiospora saccharicola]|uniref:Epoxide hydrolase N-terminal domain-containing protein n=1 Tax=Apiospora saccharicola TaxID=335842 RepID=A0ABR1UK29_9PEZI
MLPTLIPQSSMLFHILFLVAVAAALLEKAPNAGPDGPVLTSNDLGLSFKAAFSSAITPFNVSVDEAFLNMTVLKASLTRFVDDTPGQPEFTDGPPKRVVQNIASFWTSEYSWRRVETDMNSRFRQFTTVVSVPHTSFNDTPIPLHFVHHRSPRADAIPLLFLHGWPGSFLEVEPPHRLAHQPSQRQPARLPPGMGAKVMGAAFDALMREKLGYHRYVIQGGDFGALIARVMAIAHPDGVAALHSYFWVMNPAQADLERYITGAATAEERGFIEANQRFDHALWPTFGTLSALRPRKLAAALADSPVGLAVWIYDLLRPVTWGDADRVWTPERVVTWAMMQWIPGVYATLALAEYFAQEGLLSTAGFDVFPYVTQPVAISEFPLDIWYGLPLDWAQRRGNVQMRLVHDRGGHFPTLDAPDLVLADLWAFLGSGSIRGLR